MKKLILLIIMGTSFLGFTQNQSWILAPNYVPDMTFPSLYSPLPNNGLGMITLPFFGYEQVHAEGSSNMVNDPQGNILFSVVDGAIFDANGDLKDFTWHQDWIQNLDYNTDNGATQTEAFIEYYPRYSHSPETVIVRNPANCRQFYIFGAIVEKGWLETMPENYGPFLHARPYYALYDECVGEVVKRGEWFSDEPTYVPLIEVNDPIATPQTFLNPANTNGDPALTYTEYSDQTTFSGCPGFGATPMNADGSRFVCAYMMNALYVIKIESNGNLRYWKRYTGMTEFPINGYSLKRSEFEVVYDANIDKFKVAAYYAFHGDPPLRNCQR